MKPINGQQARWSENPSHQLMLPELWLQVAEIAELTNRERRVCELLFTGLTREQIARNLKVKPRTVRQHLEHIHTKLNVHNRVGVVLRVIQIRDGIVTRTTQQQTSDAAAPKA